MQTIIKTLILCALIIAIPNTGHCQDDEADLIAPDRIMSSAVPRILRWYFKPSRRPRRIPVIDEGINPAWLPKIRNVKFVIVTKEGANAFDGGAYTFITDGRQGNKWIIDFGKYNPGEGGGGDVWTAVENRRGVLVRRLADEGWGISGLSRGSRRP